MTGCRTKYSITIRDEESGKAFVAYLSQDFIDKVDALFETVKFTTVVGDDGLPRFEVVL